MSDEEIAAILLVNTAKLSAPVPSRLPDFICIRKSLELEPTGILFADVNALPLVF